jgi:hypothetical protein
MTNVGGESLDSSAGYYNGSYTKQCSGIKKQSSDYSLYLSISCHYHDSDYTKVELS